MQRSFAEVDGFRKQPKVTRQEALLAEMTRVVPWRRLEGLIEPHYPTDLEPTETWVSDEAAATCCCFCVQCQKSDAVSIEAASYLSQPNHYP